MKIELIITDIDGVWTDGGMYYDSQGNETKKFNTSDSAGVLFLKHNHVMVVNRAKKLNIKHVFLGVNDKLSCAKALCNELNIKLENVAFIGDDINDIHLLKSVGFSATPNNAPDYIKDKVDLVLNTNGGHGAFRKFVEALLNKLGLWDATVSHFVD